MLTTTPTPWGYDVAGPVPSILDLNGFHDMTGGRFVNDARIASALDASAARVRSYCGWHIAGSLLCVATIDGGGRAVWLPSTHVTELVSVTVCGADVTDACQWSRRGELRLPYSPDVLGAIRAEYVAGFGDVPEDLVRLVCDRVVADVALPYGIQQETAGSVSVSYAQGAFGRQGAARLTADERAALSAYRLEEAR